MKIKITENQYSKIRIIAEQDEYMKTYVNFCAKKAKEVDMLYSKVINESVIDILNMSIKIENIITMLNSIENDVNNQEQNMLNLWSKKLISGDDDFDLEIEKIASLVVDKITALTLILNPLEEMQNYGVEHNLTLAFKNVSPIEVQSFGPENS